MASQSSASSSDETSEGVANHADGDRDSSSDSSEDEADSQPPSKTKNPSKPVAKESSDEESESEPEEEDEGEPPKSKPSAQNPQSSSDLISDSDSDPKSAETRPTPSVSAFTVKPILSKPLETKPKPQKSSSNPPAKRPSESPKAEKYSKAKKVKVSKGDSVNESLEAKKSGINRFWSEDDEVAILQAMLDYKYQKGCDPYSDEGAFIDSVKGLLSVSASKAQLTDKIRRLKKKYTTNGDNPVFSRPHEYKLFDIAKKIWEDENGRGSHSKARKGEKIQGNRSDDSVNNRPLIKEVKVEGNDIGVTDVRATDAENEVFSTIYNHWTAADKYYNLPLPDNVRVFMKEKLHCIGVAEAKELEKQWKMLQEKELELYNEKLELLKEESRLVLGRINSPKSGEWDQDCISMEGGT